MKFVPKAPESNFLGTGAKAVIAQYIRSSNLKSFFKTKIGVLYEYCTVLAGCESAKKKKGTVVELAIVPFAVGVIFWLPLTLPRVIMRV